MSVRILAARRSIVAPRGGALAGFAPHELAAPVIRDCLDRAGLPGAAVDEVILGNALGAGGNPARLAALAAGLPERVAGLTLDRQCCGGLDALLLGQAMIAAGQAEVVLAGGVESYSRRPYRAWQGPEGLRPYDQPPFSPFPERDPLMPEAAAALAEALGIDAAAQADWAQASHAKARAAAAQLAREITPLPGVNAQADPFARRLTPQLCARAPRLAGSVTHATAAVAADGAALCLLVADHVARRLGQRGAEVLGGRTLGGDPAQPGLAPVPAIAEALSAAQLTPAQLAQAEIMEAYAVQAIACQREAGIDARIVNPRGGGLARGHPIGASGAVLAVRLVSDLGPGEVGLAAIAAAGGLGTALLIRG